MEKQSFIKWLRTPVEGVEPYSVLTTVLIAVSLTAIDTVIPFVLIIASFFFIKNGHKALGALLVALNLFPDDLPVVDEVIGTIMNMGPLWKEYKSMIMMMDKAATKVNEFEEQLTNDEEVSEPSYESIAEEYLNRGNSK